MSDSGLCFIIVLAVSAGLVIYGFMQLLKKQESGESDGQTLQRQLRGFGYLMLAQIALVVGLSICVGLNMDSIKKVIRSAKL
jgi:hypothetical protein